jgi:hypothetical protein
MKRFKNLLQSLYAYFCKSPKKHLEHYKLVEIVETRREIKWLKMWKKQDGSLCYFLTKELWLNITLWLSRWHLILLLMLLLRVTWICCVTLKYCIHGFACLLLMLEVVNDLMKLSQIWNMFVVNYMVAIKSYALNYKSQQKFPNHLVFYVKKQHVWAQHHNQLTRVTCSMKLGKCML